MLTLDGLAKLFECEVLAGTPEERMKLLGIILDMPTVHPSPRQQHSRLLVDIGPFCQGCGRDYGFVTRVLEVDHIRPKSDGGTDAYDNLTLLCPPCNRTKQNRMTLTRLREYNRTNGYLLKGNERNLRNLARIPY